MPCSAKRAGTPRGGEGQQTQTGLAQRLDSPQMMSEISAAFDASDPTMNRSESMSGSCGDDVERVRQLRQCFGAKRCGRREIEGIGG